MRLSIKLFRVRYVLKVSLSPDRKIKWLPSIFWAKVGPTTVPKEKNT
jgi:uncharacterized membrane protein SirB2